MGCFCSKGIEGEKLVHGRRKKPLKRLAASSEKEDTVVTAVGVSLGTESIDRGRERLIPEPEENGINPYPLLLGNGTVKDATTFEKSKKVAVQERWDSRDGWAEQVGLVSVGDEAGDNQQQKQQQQNLVIPSVKNGTIAEHVAAGWPFWLTKVAGEAVKGWLPRKLDSFINMEKIGQGTYSTVYKARDLLTGKIVALKKVRFVNLDPDSVQFMAREIYVLRRLDHPNVIKLEGLVASKMSNSLWLIFPYMEHDLAGLAARPGIKFTHSQVKCFMQQLFNGLNHCHNNGVLHRDIKGANLLLNDDGILKIADFGLATFFSNEPKHPLTSRVVTLWYRPPELLLGAQKYGASVDLWSSGCMLAELLCGKPIMPGRTEVEQLHMIFKLCGSPSEEYWRKSKLPHATIFKPQHPYKSNISQEFRDFPSTAVALLERLLAVDPADRGTSSLALASEFFTVEPIACDPSDLPKFPPSKELDAKKLREVEAGRQREAAKMGNDRESGRKELKNSNGMAILDANAESQRLHKNSRSSSVKHKPREDTSFFFLNDHPRGMTENGFARREGYGLSVSKSSKEDSRHAVPGLLSSNSGKLNSSRSQRSHLTNGKVARFSGLSGPLESSLASTKFPNHRDGHDQSYHSRQLQVSSHNQLDVGNASATYQLFNRRSSSHKRDERGRDLTAAYEHKRNRIMYSGPLMPTVDNIDEMLKEHERQIEQAVRKACIKRKNDKMYGVKSQSETLLLTGRI
ncbi:probable serine/threonine-protein kinase At1g54610 [Dendrobium catenatum]|uniref:[RNA-polymerase]-subunit kinase n=1 Tax=Dendrobium catenatum TaxID=906689 RepID=A0A2I0VBS0_9ASPA|nr:probable serine/threonine-protein kinase At1g54610 [Dendrobium catenatum]PKU60850.1 putative serine/threonine-protein kinase [Dendrobium catenatum]